MEAAEEKELPWSFKGDLCHQTAQGFLEGLRRSGEESGSLTFACSPSSLESSSSGEDSLALTVTYQRIEGGYAVEVVEPESERGAFFVPCGDAPADDASDEPDSAE